MPQASRALRQKMVVMFGDSISADGPITYLEKAGYVLTDDYEWVPKPGVTPKSELIEDEADCLAFLMEEWDFGGLLFNNGGENQ